MSRCLIGSSSNALSRILVISCPPQIRLILIDIEEKRAIAVSGSSMFCWLAGETDKRAKKTVNEICNLHSGVLITYTLGNVLSNFHD